MFITLVGIGLVSRACIPQLVTEDDKLWDFGDSSSKKLLSDHVSSKTLAAGHFRAGGKVFEGNPYFYQ
jgi:hypothetical protein